MKNLQNNLFLVILDELLGIIVELLKLPINRDQPWHNSDSAEIKDFQSTYRYRAMIISPEALRSIFPYYYLFDRFFFSFFLFLRSWLSAAYDFQSPMTGQQHTLRL